MASRTNEDWVWALSEPPGEAQSEALLDLHDFLLRAVLVYLSQHRGELAGWGQEAVRDLAEDLAQDALLAVQAGLDSFRGEARFTTWACRFVINRAASELRRRRYHDLSLESLRDSEPAVFQSLAAEQAGSEPEHLAEQREYLSLLQRIIQEELNDKQRAAMIGVHFLGHSMDEVAEALGISRNALYKLLHDARKRVKARLLSNHLTPGDILAAFRH
jgi:RNA polymerase sigma-70 factor (ECF subfamily)